MNQKWNLQDIKPSEAKRKKPSPTATKSNAEGGAKRTSSKRPKKTNKKLWISLSLALAIVLFGFYLIGNLTFSAEIEVEPKHRLSKVNSDFAAFEEAKNGQLTYETITVKAAAEREVTPTGQSEVEEKTKGTILVKNMTKQSQRLVATTRFASPEGLIFRTKDPVVVPPSKTNTAGEKEPGTVEIEVTATEASDAYNLAEGTAFTIPGFAEGGYDELFESITAVSVSDFTGGFKGLRYEVEEEELKQVQETMRSELREALRAKLDSDLPSGFVLFENAIEYSYETVPPVADSNEEDKNRVKIKEIATLSAPLFAEDEFARYIASAVVPGYEEEPVRIDNWNELQFSYLDSEEVPKEADRIDFTLNGNAELVWTFSETNFKEELSGEQQASLRFVVPEFKAINKANATIRPLWKRSYPEDEEKITITEVIDW